MNNVLPDVEIWGSYLTSQTFICHICKTEILSLPLRAIGIKMRLKLWKYRETHRVAVVWQIFLFLHHLSM